MFHTYIYAPLLSHFPSPTFRHHMITIKYIIYSYLPILKLSSDSLSANSPVSCRTRLPNSAIVTALLVPYLWKAQMDSSRLLSYSANSYEVAISSGYSLEHIPVPYSHISKHSLLMFQSDTYFLSHKNKSLTHSAESSSSKS